MKFLNAANPNQAQRPPQDLLFASASGLDPHISPEAARYQIQRIAKTRGMGIDAVEKLVKDMTVGRQMGILGEPSVNVLELNLALDKSQGTASEL